MGLSCGWSLAPHLCHNLRRAVKGVSSKSQTSLVFSAWIGCFSNIQKARCVDEIVIQTLLQDSAAQNTALHFSALDANQKVHVLISQKSEVWRDPFPLQKPPSHQSKAHRHPWQRDLSLFSPRADKPPRPHLCCWGAPPQQTSSFDRVGFSPRESPWARAKLGLTDFFFGRKSFFKNELYRMVKPPNLHPTSDPPSLFKTGNLPTYQQKGTSWTFTPAWRSACCATSKAFFLEAECTRVKSSSQRRSCSERSSTY